MNHSLSFSLICCGHNKHRYVSVTHDNKKSELVHLPSEQQNIHDNLRSVVAFPRYYGNCHRADELTLKIKRSRRST